MEAYFMTDVGKVRSHNEDSGGVFYNKEDQLLAIVADGMGGHAGGEVASQLATNLIQKKWEETNIKQNAKEIEGWIQQAVDEANELIYQEAKDGTELDGMGTTLVLAVCTQEFITVAHIGDSRCYLYREGKLKQLTEDHTLVNELLRTGHISQDDVAYHPRKNVLSRALGTEELVKTEVQTIMWEENDKLILCSDGLSNKLSDEELRKHLEEESFDHIGDKLVQIANERGGEDNISIALVHHSKISRVGENA
jgi:protein phosphatase